MCVSLRAVGSFGMYKMVVIMFRLAHTEARTCSNVEKEKRIFKYTGKSSHRILESTVK